MAKRYKNKTLYASDGFTRTYGSGYPDVTTPHQRSYWGTTQYIDSSNPPGKRAILIQEPYTKAMYLPMNPVTLDKSVVECTPLYQKWWLYADAKYLEYYDQGGLANLLWFKGLSTSVPPVPTQSMKDIAFAQALSRIAESPFMGAVDLGEISETLKLLRSPFKDLRDLFLGMTRDAEKKVAKLNRSYRAQSRKGRKWVRDGYRIEMERKLHTTEALANTWLEYQYGVVPLMSSVSGIAETAANSVESLVQAVHSAYGGKKTISTTVYDANPDWLDDGILNFRRKTKVQDTVVNGANYTIRYIYYPWMIDAINLARYGVSPTQTLSTLYELTKLSFVGDWFVNFGTWIKAMEPKPQCKILDVCYSHKYERHVHVEDNGGSYSYYSNVPRVANTWAHHSRSYMNRSIVTNNLQAPIPRTTGEMLSCKRTLDAVALLSRPIHKFFDRFENFIRR